MNNVVLPSRKDAEMTKVYNDLYEQIVDYSNLERAYKQTQIGQRKFRNDAIKFSMFASHNLVGLWNELKSGTYQVGRYNKFKVYEPKERIISAPGIRDKIVQFAVHTIIKEVYRNVYISDSYACIEGKGAHLAVKKVQHNMRLQQWETSGGWIVKLDVAKFFYSIDRDIMKQVLRKKISCKKTLWLLDNIINSSPEGDIGLPLGNITSQDFANIYLNELDQYVKRFLKVKRYVRYMDDVIAVVETKEDAQKLMKQMQVYLKSHLNLDTNHKTQIFPIDNGVNAYGYKIWTTHKLVRNQSKKRMKRRIKAMDRKLKTGEIDNKDVQQAVNSWLGHARHSNSFNLAKKVFKKYPYVKVESPKYRFGYRLEKE